MAAGKYVLLDASNLIVGTAVWDGVTTFAPPGVTTKHPLPASPPAYRIGDTYNTANNTVTPRVDTSDEAAGSNALALRSTALTALANNATFLAIASPTNPQATAQVRALTKQVNALIRLAMKAFDSTSDT